MQFFFVRCGRHCAKARSFTICTHKLQSGEKLRLALALRPAKKSWSKRIGVTLGNQAKQNSTTKRERHTPPARNVPPLHKTRKPETQEKFYWQIRPSVLQWPRSESSQHRFNSKWSRRRRVAPPRGHTGTSFRFPAARPGLCQTASVLACWLTL